MSAVTYLWIALGGALGSVGRAWLGFALARVTGPEFPWGTILINMVGSFVIGIFGMLTATSGGRFALPADIRAFVMVGVCGGFTTFSSFSLQTLELARDGRPGQALANIGFSLALCLAAVAAGHYAAASLNQGHVVEEAMLARPSTAGGVALAVLDRPEAAPRVLSAAADFLRLGGGGRVNALALTPEPGADLLPTEEVMTEEQRVAAPVQVRGRARALRAAFDRWAGLSQGLGAEWTEVEGDPAAAVAEHGSHADVAVLRRPSDRSDAAARDALHAALFKAGCPVLVLPPEGSRKVAAEPVVAIAWRDDAHDRKALQSALPLLRRASRVVALCGGDSKAPLPPPPALLSTHGIRAEMARVAPGGDLMGAALLVEARRIGADLLVMGAFAHSQFQERLLGGVTAQVLATADLPVL